MLKKYAPSILSVVCFLSVVVGMFVFGSDLAYAEMAHEPRGALVPEISCYEMVSLNGLLGQLERAFMRWLGVGLTIGVSAYVVFAGWRFLRRFVSGDTTNQNSI